MNKTVSEALLRSRLSFLENNYTLISHHNIIIVWCFQVAVFHSILVFTNICSTASVVGF